MPIAACRSPRDGRGAKGELTLPSGLSSVARSPETPAGPLICLEADNKKQIQTLEGRIFRLTFKNFQTMRIYGKGLSIHKYVKQIYALPLYIAHNWGRRE